MNLKQRFIAWVGKNTPSCGEMARLASRALDEPLPWRTWAKVRLHFLICVFCHRYFRQLREIHEHAPKYGEAMATAAPRGLTLEARHRITVTLLHSIHH